MHFGFCWNLTSVLTFLSASVWTEFVVEFEESQWEPGNWKELLRVPGNHHSAVLRLHGHVDYRFRVSAVNGVGRGQPSVPSERYKTPPSGLRQPLALPAGLCTIKTKRNLFQTAPDRNPENIRIEGHVPHEMDINWEVGAFIVAGWCVKTSDPLFFFLSVASSFVPFTAGDQREQKNKEQPPLCCCTLQFKPHLLNLSFLSSFHLPFF